MSLQSHIDIFISDWFSGNLRIDFNGDARLDAQDIYLFVQYFIDGVL